LRRPVSTDFTIFELLVLLLLLACIAELVSKLTKASPTTSEANECAINPISVRGHFASLCLSVMASPHSVVRSDIVLCHIYKKIYRRALGV